MIIIFINCDSLYAVNEISLLIWDWNWLLLSEGNKLIIISDEHIPTCSTWIPAYEFVKFWQKIYGLVCRGNFHRSKTSKETVRVCPNYSNIPPTPKCQFVNRELLHKIKKKWEKFFQPKTFCSDSQIIVKLMQKFRYLIYCIRSETW